MRISRLTEFDSPAADLWYDARHAGAAAGRHAPLITARDCELASLAASATDPDRRREAWGAWVGDACLGALLVEWPRQGHPQLAAVSVQVPPRHRRRGVGTALLRTGLERARAAGRGTVTTEVHVPGELSLADCPGGRFALAHGFVPGLAETRLALDLPAPKRRLDTLDGTAAGYRAHTWDGPMPPQWLAPLARLAAEMAAEAPAGQAARWDPARIAADQRRLTEQGHGLLTTMVMHVGGDPAGYTQLIVDGGGVHAQQDDTYVRRGHRGHRLGALAKARNLRELVRRYPQARYVHTWTAESNAAMHAINRRFGFRPVEVTHAMRRLPS